MGRSRDPKAPLPVLLHFCQSYRVPVDESDGIVRSGALKWRNFGWSKYRAQDKTNLECSAPLLMEPWAPNDGIDVLAATETTAVLLPPASGRTRLRGARACSCARPSSPSTRPRVRTSSACARASTT